MLSRLGLRMRAVTVELLTISKMTETDVETPNTEPQSTCSDGNEDLLTEKNVNDAIRWYRLNSEAIADALPLHIPGVIFSKAWSAKTLTTYMDLWESKSLGLKLAGPYIVYPLRTIKKALVDKAKKGLASTS